MSELTRRHFLKVTGMSLVGSSLALMGFSPNRLLRKCASTSSHAPQRHATPVRTVPSPAASSCTAWATGQRTPRPALSTSRATRIIRSIAARSVPKGAGLIDFIHSESRLQYPEYRAPGSDRWERIAWDDALDRIAKLMKQDRDANFVAKTPEGLTVNRWLTTGMLAASASSNEVGYLTHKVMRSFGMLAFDNQARV